jgi:hypothetical protein
MTKPHAIAVTVMLGAAAAAGVLAVSRTVPLGQTPSTTSTSSLEQRQAALDRARAQIATLDASVPPPLPAAPAVPVTAPQRVVLVRSQAEAPVADDDHGEREEEHGDRDDGSGEDGGWDD